jgi:ectoine hydroxylase-related dioxygenase (phytanoyl-CoA dioxygenase family)
MCDQPEQITLELNAGDAVVTDYRLLHGTYPNQGRERRDCLLLSFTPSWADLPTELRAHLIRHPALPTAEERSAATARLHQLLPSYEGEPRDLTLSRVAPREFEMSG